MKLKEIWAKYGKTDLMAAKLEIPTAKTYRAYQNIWLDWYRGYVRGVHKYFVTNGARRTAKKRRSLKMAKTAAEEWASLIWSENLQISVADEATNKQIAAIFADNAFQTRGKQTTEVGFATGMSAIVERVESLNVDAETGDIIDTENAKVKLDFINGRNIYPFTIDDDGIVEAAFLTRKGKRVSISLHLLDDTTGNYIIHNIKGDMNENGDITYNEKLDVYSFDTKSPRKWFQIIKPNIVNNICPDSPLGISIYANAIDQLETCDICFDALPEELVLGRKRLYIAAEALKPTADGDFEPTFDPNDALYYNLPLGDKPTDKPFVQESNGALRIAEITAAIQASLNYFSTKVGFGQEHYRYDAGSITTATQVISEKSDMFRHLRDHENLIAHVIKECIHTIIYILNTFTSTKVQEVTDDKISIQFDDSIIEDKNAERTRALQEINAKVLSRVEYRQKFMGETEEAAKAAIQAIDANQPTIVDIFSNT